MIKIQKCIICGSEKHRPLFRKKSARGEMFNLVKCPKCGMEFLSEYPEPAELSEYYRKEYFTQRTERGYNNYFSQELRAEIERVFKLNLQDLGFFDFEARISGNRKCLDIGCAAGYFVDFMKNRGWDSRGIDISKECADFAKSAGLSVENGDYLDINTVGGFNLVTLWATIEHLQNPVDVLRKIRKDLNDGGILYITTCRTGGLNFKSLFGPEWRYYNFPEHIYFFSRYTLGALLERSGFRIRKYITYGSNFGKSGTPARKVADFLAKKMYTGDMMAVSAEKI